MQDQSLFDKISKDVDAVLAEASTEGLNSNIFGRMFVSLADSLTGLLTTFGSNLIRINKSLKRSELHEFIDSNRLKVKTVDNISFDRLVGFKVDCPANLNGTYKNAIKGVADVYIKLGTLNVARLMDNGITDIFKKITSGDASIPSSIISLGNVITGVMKAAKPAVETCQQNFSGKFEQKVKFEDIFSNKEEWNECAVLMRDLEPRLQEAKEIHKLVQSMETTLRSVCNYLSDNQDKLNKDDLTRFGEIIKNVALVFDGYNLAVTRHLALEHNYVLMINEIYKHVK